MKTLEKYFGDIHDYVEIEVSDLAYATAIEQARINLGIETEEQAEELEEEIDNEIKDYFEDEFEREFEHYKNELENQEKYYAELNSWLNKRQGV